MPKKSDELNLTLPILLLYLHQLIFSPQKKQQQDTLARDQPKQQHAGFKRQIKLASERKYCHDTIKLLFFWWPF